MKILPVMSRGIVFLHEDGKTFEMAPLQIFLSNGGPIVRIGRNTLWFTKKGEFDGTECKISDVDVEPGFQDALEAALEAALDEQGRNRDCAPEVPYFAPGSKGYEHEARAWSSAKAYVPRADESGVAVQDRAQEYKIDELPPGLDLEKFRRVIRAIDERVSETIEACVQDVVRDEDLPKAVVDEIAIDTIASIVCRVLRQAGGTIKEARMLISGAYEDSDPKHVAARTH